VRGVGGSGSDFEGIFSCFFPSGRPVFPGAPSSVSNKIILNNPKTKEIKHNLS